jgi:hypothetical protein
VFRGERQGGVDRLGGCGILTRHHDQPAGGDPDS